jgi:hypothetical protein
VVDTFLETAHHTFCLHYIYNPFKEERISHRKKSDGENDGLVPQGKIERNTGRKSMPQLCHVQIASWKRQQNDNESQNEK